ncbi:amino acid adenylation domain-containing protein [Kitasatospora sp. MMS16-BH015]|uniref:amino acid adenylation domain-containing protein n=1 Tax=Kitasatospora sp. MMS16-BH015 TaxID=2018025 RepID=UPI000CF28D73|nr:amino acid adenylation domain-containing protein [Kitasatospora sp. MMS16-BH015]
MTQQPTPTTGAPTIPGPWATHSLVLRLTEADRIRAAAAGVGRAAPAAGFHTQAVHAPADSALADGLCRRELARPLGPAGPGLRVVLLRYSDGQADLVVLACRQVLDHRGLRALAGALAAPDGAALALAMPDGEALTLVTPDGGALALTAPDGGALAPAPDRAGANGWTPAAAPGWGLAEDRAPAPSAAAPAGHTPLPEEVVVAAAAVVLSRYERADQVRFAVLTAAAGERSGDTLRLLSLDLDAQAPLTDLLASARAALAAPATAAGGALPALALALSPRRPGEEYAPLAPGAVPLLLAWHRSATGLSFARHDHAPTVHPAVAEAFARRLLHVAAQLTQRPAGRRLEDLTLLDEAGTAEVLALTRPAAPVPLPVASLPAAVAGHAAATPEAVAVGDGRRSLTYRELDRRATAWARVLADRGAGPGTYVGVCMKRTTDLVVALLAVLKTGAAYVPLDVQAPDDRLRYIAEDAGLGLVLTSLSTFPAGPGTALLTPAELDAAAPSPAALPEVRPEHTAYVIYTSGTTGRPKGVAVTHGSVLALIGATAEELALGPADVWTFFHSVAFDFSVWEIWGCLLTAGRLVVVPYLTSREPEEFYALLLRERVTVLSQTPSAFAGLLETDLGARGTHGAVVAPRLVVFGGEALDPRMLGAWFRRHPDSHCRMVNMYGITETTVHVTARVLTSWDLDARPHCVGHPLAGWSVSVRDGLGRPLPPGAVGEITVGGPGLAREYLNQPELTSRRFVEDPFTGERLYRSGDLGRLRLDGAVDHLGRLDEQVKIRGFRIELGEIRSVLLAAPHVADAAVVVEGEGEARHLVAYLVPAAGGTTADARRHCAGFLPDYMVPAELVALPAIPLTINGKLDRAALAAARAAQRPAAPAGTGTGSADGSMAALWSRVLGTALGPDDHFFEVGGNSLSAVRLISALREAGHGQVGLRDLYRHPTPAALAARLGG